MAKQKSSKTSVIFREMFIAMILVVVLPTTFLGFVASGEISLFNLAGSIFLMIILMFMPNVLNNYADWKIDKINKKRVELHQMFKKKDLLIITAALFVLSVPFFIFGNIFLQITMLIAYFMIFNYNMGLKAKNVNFMNYFFIALYYGPIAYTVGFFFSSPNIALFMDMIWIPVFLLFVDLSFSVTKDYEDVKGDKKEGKLTLPVVFGKGKSLFYQHAMITLAFLVILASMILLKASPIYLFLFVFYGIAIYILEYVRSVTDKIRYHKAHNMIRFNALMIRTFIAVSLLAFALL